MDIPYTVEVRRDTGLTNGKIGIWLFLASEVMLFGALFASYILIRTGAPSWPRGDSILDVPLATFNTIVLISSSVTMVMAWASLMRRRFGTFRIYMGATILLGFVFQSFAPGPQKYAFTAIPPITCSMCRPVRVK
jgi:cytochrome c oxidase subunit 3